MTQPGDARWSRRGVLVTAGSLALAGLSTANAGAAPSAARQAAASAKVARALPSRASVVKEFTKRQPQHFGMFLPGMVTRGHRDVALTFDACGGPRGSKYDEKVVATLRAAEVPATLFLNARWIETNPALAAELAADPLFELGNHGWHHRPLTVRGQAAYGIVGTKSVGGAYDEIVHGLDALAELTGSRSRWYRPGTAYADDVGVAIARRMGLKVLSYRLNADFGATASTAVVAKNLAGVRKKDIVLSHFNHPEGKTAEGLAKALPGLLDRGVRFATLTTALA